MKKYELLAEDIEALIASGTIQPGERLPSVRQTITARHLSPSTVFEGLYRFGVLCIFCSAVLQRGRFAPKHAVHEYRVTDDHRQRDRNAEKITFSDAVLMAASHTVMRPITMSGKML